MNTARLKCSRLCFRRPPTKESSLMSSSAKTPRRQERSSGACSEFTAPLPYGAPTIADGCSTRKLSCGRVNEEWRGRHVPTRFSTGAGFVQQGASGCIFERIAQDHWQSATHEATRQTENWCEDVDSGDFAQSIFIERPFDA